MIKKNKYNKQMSPKLQIIQLKLKKKRMSSKLSMIQHNFKKQNKMVRLIKIKFKLIKKLRRLSCKMKTNKSLTQIKLINNLNKKKLKKFH